MKYAVIAISGTQYQVAEDQVITVDNLNLATDSKNTINDVLLTVNDDKVSVGTPNVKGASVEFQVVDNLKGKKIDIFKFKSKSRYRRSAGFRPQQTNIKITKINF